MNNIHHQTRAEAPAPAVYRYARAQAIDEGMLIDVSALAREAGFRWPVALSFNAWKEAVDWRDHYELLMIDREEAARIWDVLYQAYHSILLTENPSNLVYFRVFHGPKLGLALTPQIVNLKIVLGPGDAGEPVITIMLSSED